MYIRYNWSSELNCSNPLGMHGEVAKAYKYIFIIKCVRYGKLIVNMWCGHNSSISPTYVKSVISRFAPQFSGYNQNDSQELISFLLDGLHEDLNKVKKKPYIEDPPGDGKSDLEYSKECWDDYLLRNRSIIVDLFQGQLKVTLHCLNCGYTAIKFDPFMYLSLPIDTTKEHCTLLDCIEKFIRVENLTNDEKWYCPKCKDFEDSTIKYDLWKLPFLLIIHLKRFSYNRYGYRNNKIDNFIDYPLTELDLSDFTNYPDPVGNTYDLFAVSCHHGGTGGGHYTANCYNKYEKHWFNFNDSSCSAISERSALTGSAYVLFYTKVRIKEGGRRYTVDLTELKPDFIRPEHFERKARQSSVVPEDLPTVNEDGKESEITNTNNNNEEEDESKENRGEGKEESKTENSIERNSNDRNDNNNNNTNTEGETKEVEYQDDSNRYTYNNNNYSDDELERSNNNGVYMTSYTLHSNERLAQPEFAEPPLL